MYTMDVLILLSRAEVFVLWGYGTEIEHVIIVCTLLSRCFPASVADV